MRKRNGKKGLNYFLIVILAFVTYVILGMLVPCWFLPDVTEQFKESVRAEDFTRGSGEEGRDRVALVEDSEEALLVRLNMIEQAKERILFSTFSIKPDRGGKEVLSALYAAAERGVKVQMLGDWVSCMMDMKLDPVLFAVASHENIDIRFYNPVNLFKPWELNGRLHDKYVIIDDRLLILGGRNTSSYFLGTYNEKSLSYDRDVLVYNGNFENGTAGSAIGQVEQYFFRIWNSDYCTEVYETVPFFLKEGRNEDLERLPAMYQELREQRPELFEEVDYEEVTLPADKVTLITNPIQPGVKRPEVWHQMVLLMNQAQDRIYMQSPYVVLNDKMQRDLADVGRDVTEYDLLLNSVAGGDNYMASSDYLFRKKEIQEIGMQVHEFQGKHSMHQKSVLIDDDICIVGSFNADMRSAYINTECMLVIQGEEFAAAMEEAMAAMETKSLRVLPDGNYEESDSVVPLTLPFWKKCALGITSVVFQLIRNLL